MLSGHITKRQLKVNYDSTYFFKFIELLKIEKPSERCQHFQGGKNLVP